MLPPPETIEEMTNQTLEFLDMFFKPGESFELVSKAWNQNGRTIPHRPGTLITMPESYMQLYSQLYSEIARCNDGAWFVFHPLSQQVGGDFCQRCGCNRVSLRFDRSGLQNQRRTMGATCQNAPSNQGSRLVWR